ncbi:g11098 [Coccomyxa viridis]|uniref:G11098 protein n=1 Tax=Coccomyxa viridis TaxID=1274662 RepID=A0ABP1G7B7_9CHLO
MANLRAIFDFLTSTLSACIDGAGTNYQCSYCGKGWNSLGQSSKQRPKVCRCQMARYCTRDCQFRHWAVHKPICKAARQPGGITQEQALAFMLS